MRHVIYHRTLLLLVLAFASFMLASATTDAASGGSRPAGPILASAIVNAPGSITVMGAGFTPGGRVAIVVVDTPSGRLSAMRPTTASAPSAGRNGSQDPATGFNPGGTLAESIDRLCGVTPLVRAYDEATETWSNWLSVDTTGFALAIFGPNGSADPALGYLPGC